MCIGIIEPNYGTSASFMHEIFGYEYVMCRRPFQNRICVWEMNLIQGTTWPRKVVSASIKQVLANERKKKYIFQLVFRSDISKTDVCQSTRVQIRFRYTNSHTFRLPRCIGRIHLVSENDMLMLFSVFIELVQGVHFIRRKLPYMNCVIVVGNGSIDLHCDSPSETGLMFAFKKWRLSNHAPNVTSNQISKKNWNR